MHSTLEREKQIINEHGHRIYIFECQKETLMLACFKSFKSNNTKQKYTEITRKNTHPTVQRRENTIY